MSKLRVEWLAKILAYGVFGLDHRFGHKSQQGQRIIRHASVANNPLSLLAETMTNAACSTP